MLLSAIWLPDDQYAKQWPETLNWTKGVWENVPEFFTGNGERVRSKSEVVPRLRTKLKKMEGIPYRYELQTKLNFWQDNHLFSVVLNVRETDCLLLYESTFAAEWMIPNMSRECDAEIRNGIWLAGWYYLRGDQLFITLETKRLSSLSMRSAEQLYRAPHSCDILTVRIRRRFSDTDIYQT